MNIDISIWMCQNMFVNEEAENENRYCIRVFKND